MRRTEIAKTGAETGAAANRQVQIKFLSAPVELLADPAKPDSVGSVRVEKTALYGEAYNQRAVGTGEFEEIECGLVLRSIGYKSYPLGNIPFDARHHVIANEQGKVIDPEKNGEQITGLYCSGWVKRGPTGIIGSNIVDARETVSSIIEDIARGNVLKPSGGNGIETIKKNILERNPTKQLVTWQDFERLNAEEIQRGEAAGKPREKITSVDEMLQIVSKV